MCQPGISRRQFLRAGGALLTAALLGCTRPAGARTAGGSPGPDPGPPAAARGGAGDDQPVRIGYLPVTDATPLLIAHANGDFRGEGLTAEPPRLFRTWAQVVEAFLARQVNVIHLLVPAALWVRYGRRFPARIVAWNHVDGSALTVHTRVSRLEDLAGGTVAVPFWYSVHNVVIQKLLRRAGLEPVIGEDGAPLAPHQVRLTVMAPSDMLPALAAGRITGFIVAEPFNALAEVQHTGRILRFTGDLWQQHACCAVLMHEEDLRNRPAWSQAVVNALVRAQVWIRSHRAEAARLLARDGGGYLPHSAAVLERVFTHYDPDEYGPAGAIRHPEWGGHRIDFQPYPYPSYTKTLVRFLQETRVGGEAGFLAGLDPEFVARDLVDYEYVKKAVSMVGGPAAFGRPAGWEREEVIDL